MSDAPKTIWASQCGKLIVQDFMERLSVDIEYTRTDHCDALIAADREAIAQFFDAKAEDMRIDGSAAYQGDVLGTLEYVSQAIRSRTLADAQATLATRDKRVRDEAIDSVLKEVEGYLPEFGAGEPQDGTDRIIDQCWRDFRKVVAALIDADNSGEG